ncbi:MAG TPA: radical SAM protein [Candidatus Hydrogenedens sp.]|nr:B12-binding domain-containing radical SAM protein [Candidatus Hydrogenedens sp.]HOK08850.1 radical SAM protein [Candidatus Hydrogenedens sp.]HOL18664.1 radical SAM protein [Candidatus Hydrogenedens sp.]HPP58539.1 radical SAM protein [Candidatus Hydrogenedens sp.]
MKVLLLSLQRNLNILGLKLLHQILLERGYDSNLLYLNRFNKENKRMLDALKGFVRDLNPSWVGISVTASEFHDAKEITYFLKREFDSFPVIWGGIQATTAVERCVQIADYLCVGEGEQTVVDICEALTYGKPLKDINNLAWFEDGEIKVNPLNPIIEDLDSLPFVPRLAQKTFILPKDNVMPLTRKLYMKYSAFYGGIYRIMQSRGCPHKCSYCVNSIFPKLYHNWRVRWTSPKRMVDEIVAGVSEDLPLLFISIFNDNFFAQTTEQMREFFDLYKKRVGKPLILFSSPNFLTEEKLKMAVDGGLASIHVGLQTGSESVCKNVYNRQMTPQKFKEVAEIIHKYPVVPYYDIICDNPFETEEDQIETVKVLMGLSKPYFFLIFSLTLYEGTDLRERVKKEKPEFLHDDTTKDFLVPAPTELNHLQHFATIFPAWAVNYLLNRYREKRNSWFTKLLFKIYMLVGYFFLQPLIYLWILLKFNRYSLTKFFKNLPKFIDFRALNIFGHFHTGRDSTYE